MLTCSPRCFGVSQEDGLCPRVQRQSRQPSETISKKPQKVSVDVGVHDLSEIMLSGPLNVYAEVELLLSATFVVFSMYLLLF